MYTCVYTQMKVTERQDRCANPGNTMQAIMHGDAPTHHLRHTATARGGHLSPSGYCKIACQADDGDDGRGEGGLKTQEMICAAGGGLCWACGHKLSLSEGLEAGGGGEIGRPLLDNSSETVTHTFDFGSCL